MNSVSQNFLTSTRTIERLLAVANITRADAVWEIGAGKGHITRQLQKRCGQLTAVEIDPGLCRALGEKMRGMENLRLVQGDFLQMRLPPHLFASVYSMGLGR